MADLVYNVVKAPVGRVARRRSSPRWSRRGGNECVRRNLVQATGCSVPTGYPIDATASARHRLGPFPSCPPELFTSSRIE